MASETPQVRVLWRHPSPEKTHIYKFKTALEKKRKLQFSTFHDLFAYSVNHRAAFYKDCFEYFPIIYEGSYTTVVDETARIDSLPKWFTGVRLNYAENILYTVDPSSPFKRSTLHKESSKVALVEIREGLFSTRPFTWGQLRARVSLFASAMKAHGVKKGDCVALIAGNSIDTLCVFLGVTSLGGLFSSSSTDMGVQGILERLRQIKPKWVFFDDASVYNRKTEEMREKIEATVAGMKSVKEFQGVISVPRFAEAPRDVSKMAKVTSLQDFLAKGQEGEIEFIRVDFMEGFLIVYSSGTTGPPKCIVHGVGGLVLGGWKEGFLHREADETSTVMQFTTTGWIMYLMSVQTLLFGARLIMYDGSPFVPNVDTFLRVADEQRVTHFGTSPRFLATIQSAGVVPKRDHELSCLKVVTCTGMVLPPTQFAWFYSEKGFPPQVHLANISGGTDLAGAFGDSNALLPVYATGGCQSKSLGIDVRIYDSAIEAQEGRTVEGREVPIGQPGELVATKAFPNMPIAFYSDEGNRKYHSAYFARFDNVWTHGDFIMEDPATHSIIFLGRADGVLNPSGIRFGSAEIYSVIDSNFKTIVEDSLCVGQRRSHDQDESVLLFLKLHPAQKFTPKLASDIKFAIAAGLSKRHVPKYIFETPEIPTTINGKKIELPVKYIVSGQKIKPSGTLANPYCLKYYEKFVDVEKAAAEQRSKL
ncbi:MAG: hypothetical protein MMC33_003145 [Icmadophila ericetorum]|nr:hypothetical protein [Icmadophila ericetorum]